MVVDKLLINYILVNKIKNNKLNFQQSRYFLINDYPPQFIKIQGLIFSNRVLKS